MEWIFGTTNLSELGYLIVLEDYLNAPEKRGDNIFIPYRHGRIYTKKFYDERVMSFGLTVHETTLESVENTLDTLKMLAGNGQQTLTAYMNNGSIRNAQAEIVNDFGVTRPAPLVAKVTIDFLIAGAFMRSATQETNNIVIDAAPTTETITNPGTVEEREATIVLTGPLQNTVITNSTNGVSLTYTGAIAAPRVVTISVVAGEYVATDDLAANKIGQITHSGSEALFVLDPGANSLSIADDTATTGEVDINYYPPFL